MVVLRTLFFVFAIFFSSKLLLAQELQLEVSPKSGTLADVFTLRVIVKGSNVAQAPFLEGGEDFDLQLSGSQRNEVVIINGQVDSKTIYEYRLFPKKQGALQTPAARLEAGALQLFAQPLIVKVEAAKVDNSEDKDLFFRQSISPNEVYLGQQLSNTLELYSSIKLLSPQILDLSFDDFFHLPLGKDQSYLRYVRGTQYNVTSLSRALWPLKAAELQIPARKVRAQVLVRKKSRFPSLGGAFDDDFFSSFFDTVIYEEKIVVSNPLTLKVNPLPALPPDLQKLNSFKELVGKTWLKLTLDEKPIKLGEGKTLVIEVFSYGNLNNLKELNLSLEDFSKVYAESPEVNYEERSGLLLTKKTFRFSIVPTKVGTFSIPALRLIYFDPQAAQYSLSSTETRELKVLPNPNYALSSAPEANEQLDDATPPQAPAATREPKLPQEKDLSSLAELRYEDASWFEILRKRLSLGSLVLIIFLLGFAAFLIWLAFSWRKTQLRRKQLVREIETSADEAAFDKIFKNLLERRLGSQSDFLTRSAIEQRIAEQIANPDLRFHILRTLDLIEELKYSGTKDELMLKQARKNLRELSEVL